MPFSIAFELTKDAVKCVLLKQNLANAHHRNRWWNRLW